MPDLQTLLQEIDRLDQEATKGPWTSIGNDCGGKVYEPSGYPLPGCTSCGENEATYEGQDAEFIALARTALPQLAAAVRAGLELHKTRVHDEDPTSPFCNFCGPGTPCETTRAITDALGGDND